MPLPLSLLLLLLGVLLLAWAHLRRTGIVLACTGILALLLFSLSPVANAFLDSLEHQYHPLTLLPKNIHFIVVLGGGNGGSRNYPPNTRLSSASLARLIEAIRLSQQNPNTTLVLSGGRVFGSATNASVMNNTATTLGISKNHMQIRAGSRDTVSEAKNLKPLLQQHSFVLVTSAYHMPRAMRIFKAAGMRPIPAPTQFLIKIGPSNPKYYLPNGTSLIYSDIAVHEYLGLLWFYCQTRLFHQIN